MTLIYRAPEDTPHVCALKTYEHLPQTSIVRCDDCGTYWERMNIMGEWSIRKWRRVTRWNRQARRRIREAPRPHIHDGHCVGRR